MTIGGWIMLSVSWAAIGALTLYTLRLSTRARPGDLSAPLEIEAELEEQEARKDEPG